MSQMLASLEQPKAEVKKIAVKPFTGKVKGKKVRLRAQADTESAIIRELNKGELISVVAEKGDFWVIEPADKMKAFVYRSYILDGAIEGNKVNVRLHPNVDAPVLTHLNSGDAVDGVICSTNNKWMEISLPEGVHFYVAKQFIENAGSPEVKRQHEKRRHTAEQLLDSAKYFGRSELTKNFSDIDFAKATQNYHAIIKDYSDFTDLVTVAKEDLSLLQEEYIDKRLAYAEAKNNVEEEALATVEAALSQTVAAITDKMKLWEPIEESIYLTWSSINESKTLDEYYADQKLSAVEVSGILEPYAAAVKCKPGDFIIKDKDLPVAYVYSTQINLQNLVGQKVTLKGTPRPNNNFAFPAYFVLSSE
jgi:uncharacterized protein YgiM (DUF1202 family)